jgi:hypothetical protein
MPPRKRKAAASSRKDADDTDEQLVPAAEQHEAPLDAREALAQQLRARVELIDREGRP